MEEVAAPAEPLPEPMVEAAARARQLPQVLGGAPAAILMIDPDLRQVVYANAAAIERRRPGGGRRGGGGPSLRS